MNKRQSIGKWGEKIAEEFLISKGLILLERNYYSPHGEIDLVMMDNGIVVFVEVKTRRNSTFGKPEISINPKKAEHITLSAQYYLQNHTSLDMHWRVDVIAVEGQPACGTPLITWFENALN